MPQNGIYILFEKNELAHGGDRIVRIGTHTGDNQLQSRIKQHFIKENKDRSIFRKNIGRCILNKSKSPFLEYWNKDLTARKNKEKYQLLIDFDIQNKIEKQISEYMKESFSLVFIEVDSKLDRLRLESKSISTVCQCSQCIPSSQWLGNYSPLTKIRDSGLWQVQELYKVPFSNDELTGFVREFTSKI